MAIKDDDFGFSFQDSKPPPAPVVNVVDPYKDKYNTLYAMILPLLKNLMASPEKDTILWRDRVVKVTAFLAKINAIDGR